MKVHAIQTGRVMVKQAQIVGRGTGFWRRLQPVLSSEWAGWLPTYAWAIEHPAGAIVVDTGAAAHLMNLPKWHPFFQFAAKFDIAPEQEIGPQLRSLGIAPRDVKTVILTHLHCDHDGGVGHFPNSKIFADAGEIALARGMSGPILGYLSKRWPSWFDPQPLAFRPSVFGPFGQSVPLTSDGRVLAIRTPGHTPHHVSVAVRIDDKVVLLAGDTSYLESTMLSGTLDGISPNASQAKATLRSIRSLAAQTPMVYLPTHDPESAHRLSQLQAVPQMNIVA